MPTAFDEKLVACSARDQVIYGSRLSLKCGSFDNARKLVKIITEDESLKNSDLSLEHINTPADRDVIYIRPKIQLLISPFKEDERKNGTIVIDGRLGVECQTEIRRNNLCTILNITPKIAHMPSGKSYFLFHNLSADADDESSITIYPIRPAPLLREKRKAEAVFIGRDSDTSTQSTATDSAARGNGAKLDLNFDSGDRFVKDFFEENCRELPRFFTEIKSSIPNQRSDAATRSVAEEKKILADLAALDLTSSINPKRFS